MMKRSKSIVLFVTLACLLAPSLPAKASDSGGTAVGSQTTVTYRLVPRNAIDATLVGDCGVVTFTVSNRGADSFFFMGMTSVIGFISFVDWNINWNSFVIAFPPQIYSGNIQSIDYVNNFFWAQSAEAQTNNAALVVATLTGDATINSPFFGFTDCQIIPNPAFS